MEYSTSSMKLQNVNLRLPSSSLSIYCLLQIIFIVSKWHLEFIQFFFPWIYQCHTYRYKHFKVGNNQNLKNKIASNHLCYFQNYKRKKYLLMGKIVEKLGKKGKCATLKSNSSEVFRMSLRCTWGCEERNGSMLLRLRFNFSCFRDQLQPSVLFRWRNPALKFISFDSHNSGEWVSELK